MTTDAGGAVLRLGRPGAQFQVRPCMATHLKGLNVPAPSRPEGLTPMVDLVTGLRPRV